MLETNRTNRTNAIAFDYFLKNLSPSDYKLMQNMSPLNMPQKDWTNAGSEFQISKFVKQKYLEHTTLIGVRSYSGFDRVVQTERYETDNTVKMLVKMQVGDYIYLITTNNTYRNEAASSVLTVLTKFAEQPKKIEANRSYCSDDLRRAELLLFEYWVRVSFPTADPEVLHKIYTEKLTVNYASEAVRLKNLTNQI